MLIIILGTPILIGFILGYFLNTSVVICIAVFTAILAVVLRPKRELEIGAFLGITAWIVLGIGFVVMLSTHLYVSNTSLSILDLEESIFRQQ